MTGAATNPAPFAVRDSSVARLEAAVHTSWAQLARRFGSSSGPSATPFQGGAWLQAWYDTVGAQAGTEPLPLEIRDAATGKPLFGVPLVKRQQDSKRVVEFADGGLTDYNAPLIGEGWRRSDSGSGALVTPSALHDLLRDQLCDCDQIQFRKMPAHLAGTANPFAHLPGHRPSVVGTNVVKIEGEGSWGKYRARMAKKVRKELERSFRVFQRDGSNAQFCAVTDTSEAISILERIEALQEERMRELGLPFFLNEPQYAAFYRRLIELDLSNGRLLLTVLKSDPDEVIGALLGIVDGHNYAMVRLAHAGKAWSHCSPGKLMIDRTMHYLHGQGVTNFDFTTGDYRYKKGFLTKSEPLVDVSLGLSLSGRLALTRENMLESAKDQFRRFPKSYGLLKRVLPGA